MLAINISYGIKVTDIIWSQVINQAFVIFCCDYWMFLISFLNLQSCPPPHPSTQKYPKMQLLLVFPFVLPLDAFLLL